MISIFLTQVDSCSQRRRLLIWALLLRHWSTNNSTVFTCAFVSTCYESKAYVSIYVCLYMFPYVCVYLFSTAPNCQTAIYPIIKIGLLHLFLLLHQLYIILLNPFISYRIFSHTLTLSQSFSLFPTHSLLQFFFPSLPLYLSSTHSLSLFLSFSISAYSIRIPFLGLTVFHIRIRCEIMRVRTWLLLPAVVTPPFWKAGFNFFKAEIEVSSLIPTYVVKFYLLHLWINFHLN